MTMELRNKSARPTQLRSCKAWSGNLARETITRVFLVVLGLQIVAGTAFCQGTLITSWEFNNYIGGNGPLAASYYDGSYVNATPTVVATPPSGGSATAIVGAGGGSGDFAMQISGNNMNTAVFGFTFTASTAMFVNGFDYAYQTSPGQNGNQVWQCSVNGGSWVPIGAPINWNSSYTAWNTITKTNFFITLTPGQTIVFTDTYNGAAANSAVRFDNLRVFVYTIPEPSGMALLAFGLCLGGVAARRMCST